MFGFSKTARLERRRGRAKLPAMHMALFHPAFSAPRGAENLALAFAEALRGEGHEVRLLGFAFDDAAMGGRLAPFVPQLIPEPRTRWTGLPDARTLRALAKALEGCDLAMAHNHPSNAYLGLCGTPAKTLWYCHEPHRSLFAADANPAMAAALREGRLDPRSAMGRAIRRALQRSRWKRILSPRHRGRIALDRAGVARLDAVWANSNATAEAVSRIYGRDAEVFHPAVAIAEALPDAPPWERPLRILVMGGLGAYKGVSTLLEGFARFLKAGPGSAVLEIVGKGRELPALQAEAARLGLGEAARFHGFLADADLARLRSRCHAFAAFPGDEPFGLVFAEAAGAGLLLLGPDHGGPREILDDGRAGILADAFDPMGISAAFTRLAGLAAAERDSLRQAAFTEAKARSDLRSLGPRLAARLRHLLNGA